MRNPNEAYITILYHFAWQTFSTRESVQNVATATFALAHLFSN
jgi:hypothetical protein